MVRAENLETKLASLRRFLLAIERYRTIPIAKVLADQDLRGAAERYLYLAAQASIDLAEMFISIKQLGKCESMTDAFRVLERAAVIDSNLCSKLIRMVGFRNALSHGYENLNYQIVEQVLQQEVLDLYHFADLIEAQIKRL